MHGTQQPWWASIVEIIKSLKDALILGTYLYVNFHGNKGLVNVIKAKVFEVKDYLYELNLL